MPTGRRYIHQSKYFRYLKYYQVGCTYIVQYRGYRAPTGTASRC
jgi:hypothetical protein